MSADQRVQRGGGHGLANHSVGDGVRGAEPHGSVDPARDAVVLGPERLPTLLQLAPPGSNSTEGSREDQGLREHELRLQLDVRGAENRHRQWREGLLGLGPPASCSMIPRCWK